MNRKILALIIQFCIIPTLRAEELSTQQLPSGAVWIKKNWQNNSNLIPPVQWRTPVDVPSSIKGEIHAEGLSDLFISGSASPSLNNLLWLGAHYGSRHPIYLIDLRQETHLYADGKAISIFLKRDEINWGKSPARIKEEERCWINRLNQDKSVILYNLSKPIKGFKTGINPQLVHFKESYSEATAAARAKLNYLRIEVPDYYPPTPQQVDSFLHFYQQLPANAWLHFHCAGGKGRTTTFMTMVDILHNTPQISLADITKRQALLGGINLLGSSSSLRTQTWKSESHQAREDFIRLFYRYVVEAYPKKLFSTWFSEQRKGSDNAPASWWLHGLLAAPRAVIV